MGDKPWKRSERRVARILGGKRIPVSGRQRGDVPDVDAGWISCEVKHRKRLPDWLLDAMSQARAAARDGQLAVAVLHEAGTRHADNLVVLRLADFREWFGGGVDADET
jgi:hypothetical protein